MIVDDEAPARRILARTLDQAEGFEVVAECGDGSETLRKLQDTEVDVLFLDVQMPELDGFGVLESLDDDRLPWVVFVTAYDHYALRAFDVGAVDYLLKPFDDDRIEAALTRVRDRVATRDRQEFRAEVRSLARRLRELDAGKSLEPGTDSIAQDVKPHRIAVRLGGRVTFVHLDRVRWFEADNYYVRLHLENESHLVRESLTRLESKLDPAHYLRVHRSAIVRLDQVKELRSCGGGKYVLQLLDGTTVRISRTRRAEVMRALGVE